MDLLPHLAQALDAAAPLSTAALPAQETLHLADPTPDPSSGPGGDYPNWDSPAVAPPGLDQYADMWIGWGYWAAGLAGFFGLLGAGIWVMIGRFTSRSGMAADGLRHGVSAVVGICIVLLASSLLTGMFR